jgi:hypothetical protein
MYQTGMYSIRANQKICERIKSGYIQNETTNVQNQGPVKINRNPPLALLKFTT